MHNIDAEYKRVASRIPLTVEYDVEHDEGYSCIQNVMCVVCLAGQLWDGCTGSFSIQYYCYSKGGKED